MKEVMINLEKAIDYALESRMELKQRQINIDKSLFEMERVKSLNEFNKNNLLVLFCFPDVRDEYSPLVCLKTMYIRKLNLNYVSCGRLFGPLVLKTFLLSLNAKVIALKRKTLQIKAIIMHN